MTRVQVEPDGFLGHVLLPHVQNVLGVPGDLEQLWSDIVDQALLAEEGRDGTHFLGSTVLAPSTAADGARERATISSCCQRRTTGRRSRRLHETCMMGQRQDLWHVLDLCSAAAAPLGRLGYRRRPIRVQSSVRHQLVPHARPARRSLGLGLADLSMPK
jgi:hypothetical protein